MVQSQFSIAIKTKCTRIHLSVSSVIFECVYVCAFIGIHECRCGYVNYNVLWGCGNNLGCQSSPTLLDNWSLLVLDSVHQDSQSMSYYRVSHFPLILWNTTCEINDIAITHAMQPGSVWILGTQAQFLTLLSLVLFIHWNISLAWILVSYLCSILGSSLDNSRMSFCKATVFILGVLTTWFHWWG